MTDNYDKEWIEQRLYTIKREQELEGDSMYSKTYEKLTLEAIELRQKLKSFEEAEPKLSEEEEKQKDLDWDRFFRHMEGKFKNEK